MCVYGDIFDVKVWEGRRGTLRRVPLGVLAEKVCQAKMQCR